MKSGYGIDMMVVVLYFLVVLVAGYIVGRRHLKDSARDFMTGGKSMNWIQTGLTLIAQSIDTGIMGVAGIGFIWGLSIHPNAVNLWFSAPLAAMFLIPIYWRSKIVTTPELLEKRFNPAIRATFSVLMSVLNIIFLGTGVYLGALILNEIYGWNLYLCSAAVMGIVGVYVMMGGMKAALAINIYQAILITLSVIVIGIVCIIKVNELLPAGLLSINIPTPAGDDLPTTKLPVNLNLFSDYWYPLPSGIIWASLAGVAWMTCNFQMVQRLLAAKNEKHAQKAILFTAGGHVVTYIFAYAIGVSLRYIDGSLMPDKTFLYAIFNFFPTGIRGLLIAGLMASLFAMVDGVLTSSGTLITQDIYLRFVKPHSSDKEIKRFVRIIQALIIVFAYTLVLPFAMKSLMIAEYTQALVADIFGVIVSLFFVGVFYPRATAKAAFVAMVMGTIASVIMDAFTNINFSYVGLFSFLITTIIVIVLSQFEKPKSRAELENLTIFTLTDVKGPWVGLKSWPGLWKWIIGIFVGWWLLILIWEYLVKIF